MDKNEQRLYEIFTELNITDYVVTEHVAITSTEESVIHGLTMEGLNLKNLFLKEKKTDQCFMLTLDDNRHADLKYFKTLTGWSKIRFATEEELLEILDLLPGAVTPLALFNDTDKRITLVLDKKIKDADDMEKISFHPCRNTATLTMRKKDFMKFLAHAGNPIIFES